MAPAGTMLGAIGGSPPVELARVVPAAEAPRPA